jgi:hypothetical protein
MTGVPAARAQRQDRGPNAANLRSTTVNAARASSAPAKRGLSKLPSFRGPRACVPQRSRSPRRGRAPRRRSACKAGARSRWRPSPPLRLTSRHRPPPLPAAGSQLPIRRNRDIQTFRRLHSSSPCSVGGKSRRDASRNMQNAGLQVRRSRTKRIRGVFRAVDRWFRSCRKAANS